MGSVCDCDGWTAVKRVRKGVSSKYEKKKRRRAHHGVLHIRVYPRLLRVDADLHRKVHAPANREAPSSSATMNEQGIGPPPELHRTVPFDRNEDMQKPRCCGPHRCLFSPLTPGVLYGNIYRATNSSEWTPIDSTVPLGHSAWQGYSKWITYTQTDTYTSCTCTHLSYYSCIQMQ